jgi:hypothetical protein
MELLVKLFHLNLIAFLIIYKKLTCFIIAGDSYLAQLAQYVGMVLVGLIIPILLKNKQNSYSRLNQDELIQDDIHMVCTFSGTHSIIFSMK